MSEIEKVGSKKRLMPFPEFVKQCPINARWAWFNRKDNGLEESGAVIRYGRRLLVNPTKFFEWLEKQGLDDRIVNQKSATKTKLTNCLELRCTKQKESK
ncbi:MAG: hypothetical protein HQL07_03055 [Nitrospirae bacterium]|nr:hypothetical protein [Magnetococcales bacterium]HAT50436.1 hypothetical protein [Alphaproteobacteria bacterium]